MNESLGIKIGDTEHYPCGCVGQYSPEFGWKHYVNPACKYDNILHPKIKGYEYLPWELYKHENCDGAHDGGHTDDCKSR